MSQCVPSWDDIEEHQMTTAPKLTLGAHSNVAAALDVPMVDYEVAELTWENGQLAMHGLGPPRVPNKPVPPPSSNSPSKYNTTASAWEKPRASGTLESIVNQATYHYHPTFNKSPFSAASAGGDELLPWTTTSAIMTMDALVPCTNTSEDLCATRTPLLGCSTRVGSCSGAPMRNAANKHGGGAVARRVPAVGTNSEWSSRADRSSASGSSSLFMRGNKNTNTNSHLVMTMDTGTDRDGPEREFTSTSLASPGNTSSDMPCTKATATTTADDHDSVCHSKTQREAGDKVQKKKGIGKSSVSSTKRSRAAAIHNQSERKRRDKINQRMKTLQKLVPNSSKTDKASMLDEVIEYLKQLQAQVHMIGRMNMPHPHMMLPMAMQQQLQMSLMNPMGMGIGMGMGLVDMNTIARPNLISPALLHPSAFMPVTSWDGAADGRLSASGSIVPDPLSFLACQSQPMTMEAYSRMAAFYQQMSNQLPPPKY